jgi:hypothetical protein
MNKLKLAVVLLLSIIISVSLFAQEDEQTIEELYLQSQIKVKIIKSEAESVDRDMKKIAIQDLENMIADGEIAEDDRELISILSSLGSEGISNQVIEQGSVINNFPLVRMDAVRLLGEVGGEIARDSIVSILLTDNEPTVLAEAIVALSKVGVDENGVVEAVLADAMRSQTALVKDNNFANAYIIAVGNLAESGSIKDYTVIEELTKIYNHRNGYAREVRLKAFDLLITLKE